MCVCALPECMYMYHMCSWCPQRPKEGIRFPRTGLRDHHCLDNNPWASARASSLYCLAVSPAFFQANSPESLSHCLKTKATANGMSPKAQHCMNYLKNIIFTDFATDIMKDVLNKPDTKADLLKSSNILHSFVFYGYTIQKHQSCSFFLISQSEI